MSGSSFATGRRLRQPRSSGSFAGGRSRRVEVDDRGVQSYLTANQDVFPASRWLRSSVGASSCTVSPSPNGSGSATLDFTPNQPSQTDQATFAEAAVLASASSVFPTWAGFNWWTWYFATNNATYENGSVTFAPKPAAQTVFANLLPNL